MQNIIITILRATLVTYSFSELSQHVDGENLRSASITRNTAQNNKRSSHGVHYTHDGPVAVDHSSDDAPTAEGEPSADDPVVEASADDAGVLGVASADDPIIDASADDAGVLGVASADDPAGDEHAGDDHAGDDHATSNGLIQAVGIDDD